jgi:ribonuclease HI
MYKLFADGGSRGNPGPAAGAFYLETTPPQGGSIFIGTQTNNVAEYQGLILGLKTAIEKNILELDICLDSLLIVNQIKGLYKVKHPNMIPLFLEVKNLLGELKSWKIQHIPRAANAKADALVNECLDKQQQKVNV